MTASNPFMAPRQPAAPSIPFDTTYEQVPRNANSSSSIPRPAPSGSGASGRKNPFALYDDTVDDDDGADTGRWESEPTGTRPEARFWQPRFYAAYFDINVSERVLPAVGTITIFRKRGASFTSSVRNAKFAEAATMSSFSSRSCSALLLYLRFGFFIITTSPLIGMVIIAVASLTSVPLIPRR